MIHDRRQPVQRRKILLVDDDMEYGAMLRGFAEAHGIEVDAVTSDALKYVVQQADSYDVVLLNYEYERFTGLQAAEALGRALPHKPLVMVGPTLKPWQHGDPGVATIRASVSKWEGMQRVLTTALWVR